MVSSIFSVMNAIRTRQNKCLLPDDCPLLYGEFVMEGIVTEGTTLPDYKKNIRIGSDVYSSHYHQLRVNWHVLSIRLWYIHFGPLCTVQHYQM